MIKGPAPKISIFCQCNWLNILTLFNPWYANWSFFRYTIWKWKSLLELQKSLFINFSHNQTNFQFEFGFPVIDWFIELSTLDLFLNHTTRYGSISQFSNNTWSQKETLEFRKDDSDSWEDNFVLLFLLQSFRSHLSNRSQK